MKPYKFQQQFENGVYKRGKTPKPPKLEPKPKKRVSYKNAAPIINRFRREDTLWAEYGHIENFRFFEDREQAMIYGILHGTRSVLFESLEDTEWVERW